VGCCTFVKKVEGLVVGLMQRLWLHGLAAGAARVALGPELPAVFTNNDTTWAELEAAASAEVRVEVVV